MLADEYILSFISLSAHIQPTEFYQLLLLSSSSVFQSSSVPGRRNTNSRTSASPVRYRQLLPELYYMKGKMFFAFFLIVVSGTNSVAQTNLPNATTEDLSTSETQVLSAANWIITTGLTVELEKRKPVNSIVLK